MADNPAIRRTLANPFGVQIDETADVLVSTDDRVYISREDGATWRQASLGLPRNPHCADLRFASSYSGAWLYLSTFGRSVYVVRLRGGQYADRRRTIKTCLVCGSVISHGRRISLFA
jgi:hypothetical protein